jgi:hypothetical protein
VVVALALALLGGVEGASAESSTDAETASDPGQACACGNSCINRDYQCHKGRGCACDSDEVCG